MPASTLDDSKSTAPASAGKSIAPASAGSILAIFPGALGDLICAIPALRAIARRHRDAAFELMARAELARFATGRFGFPPGHSADGLYADSPDAGRRTTEGSRHGPSRGHSIDRREVAQLFAARSGPVADEVRTFFGSFTHVYSFFAADDEHFRTALADATGGRASFLPFRPAGAGHIAAAYLREIDALREAKSEDDAESQDVAEPEDVAKTSRMAASAALDCSLDIYPEELEVAEDRLADLGLAAGNFILILPGSGSKAKNWPAENFVSLATILTPRIRPLVILGPAESGLEPLFDAAGIPVIARLELAEVAALARLSRGFIGNDSGVSHLAAASGAPGVVLFGPTDPHRWRPLGPATVIRREPLSALTPAEAALAIAAIIDAKTHE